MKLGGLEMIQRAIVTMTDPNEPRSLESHTTSEALCPMYPTPATASLQI